MNYPFEYPSKPDSEPSGYISSVDLARLVGSYYVEMASRTDDRELAENLTLHYQECLLTPLPEAQADYYSKLAGIFTVNVLAVAVVGTILFGIVRWLLVSIR